MSLDYSAFDAMSFDCYGTLIDWERGIWDAFQPLITKNDNADLIREVTLRSFAELENAQQAATPDMLYSDVLRHVHGQFADANGLVTSTSLNQEFGESVPRWPAFSDSTEALRRLKNRYRLVILSNVHEAGFASSNRHLDVDFDAVYTAEQIGSYKPDPANFNYLFSHLDSDLGIDRSRTLHVAQSLYHDHVPAKAAGMNCVWIDRQNLSSGGNWGATATVEQWPDIDAVFTDLTSFADAALVV
ncbi:MAG: haloacid dehalogenase type II [Pseudomonadota bacterium]|nr:haloacid dehalogenase type II [Pseudomonadota bacterium]